MSKILELRTKRNTLWEQTKDFLEKNRGENGLVKAEAVEQYNKMAQEVKDLGAEIERLEQQAQIEAQLSAPTSSPVHADPKNGAKKDVKPTARSRPMHRPERAHTKEAGWRPNSPNPARAFRWWCIPRTATSWHICWKKVMPSAAADGWQEDPISLRQSRPASSSSSLSSKRH